MGFSEDIKKFAQKCGDNADQVIRQIVLDIGRSVIEKTPVGNPSLWQNWEKGGVSKNPDHWLVKTGFVGEGYTGGHARGNWSHSIGSRVVQEYDVIDPSGSQSLDRITASIPQKAAGLVHFIQNSVPYIQRLEDGYSKQAPNGMVALTKIEFQTYLQNAVAKVNP